MQADLKAARLDYGQCAKAVYPKIATLSPTDSEKVIGLGTARHWLDLSLRLTAMSFAKPKSAAPRRHGWTEATRFTFMWTAINALFARPSLYVYFDPTAGPKSELSRFRSLVQASGIPPAFMQTTEAVLHSLLSRQVNIDDWLWGPRPPVVTTLHVLHHKYTTTVHQRMTVGTRIAAALAPNPISRLDLPLVIYATRNWILHGALTDNSFRGGPTKFARYIDAINVAMAKIHSHAAAYLLKTV